MGVEAGFGQDTADLASRHRKLQRRFHPDRFVSTDDRQRRLSLEHATALNDAFRILRDPMKRAEYMLKLRGLDLQDGTNQIRLDPMFLMEILELREAIEELPGADTHVERGRIERDVALRYEDILAQLGEGLGQEDSNTEALAQHAAQLKYLKRILEE